MGDIIKLGEFKQEIRFDKIHKELSSLDESDPEFL